jgi:hypothetical protein
MRHLAIGVFLAIVAAATACGGGGGGGSSDGGTAGGGSQSPVSASFTPDEPAPGNNTVAMAESSRVGDLVTIRVNVVGVNGVYGAAFDVTFDSSKLDYVGWSAGTLLEQGGNAPNYSVVLSQAGQLVIGASRTGNTGVNASGQSLVNLTFRVETTGTFPIAIENPALYDSQIPPQVIPGISWFAGSLVGV